MVKFLHNKIIKGIVNFLEIMLLIICCIYVAIIALQKISNNRSVFGYRFYTVATSSMKPIYVPNDVIVVEDIDLKDLKVGDDIAYYGENMGHREMIISHRIVYVSEDHNTFKTKGVANQVEDPPIKKELILGKITGKLPIISPINHVLRNQYGFFFLVFFPLVLVIVLEVLELITNLRLKNNEIVEIKKKEENSSDGEEIL